MVLAGAHVLLFGVIVVVQQNVVGSFEGVALLEGKAAAHAVEGGDIDSGDRVEAADGPVDDAGGFGNMGLGRCTKAIDEILAGEWRR